MARRRQTKTLDENAQLAGTAATELLGMFFGHSKVAKAAARLAGKHVATFVDGAMPPVYRQPMPRLPRPPKGMKYVKVQKTLNAIPVSPGVEYIPPPKKRTT